MEVEADVDRDLEGGEAALTGPPAVAASLPKVDDLSGHRIDDWFESLPTSSSRPSKR